MKLRFKIGNKYYKINERVKSIVLTTLCFSFILFMIIMFNLRILEMCK